MNMRTVLVAVLFSVGCGSGMGTDGTMGTDGQNGQNGMTGATGPQGPAGPIGPHVTVKDKNGQTLGVLVGGQSDGLGFVVLTYHSTINGMPDNYLLHSNEDEVYNPTSNGTGIVGEFGDVVGSRLYWNTHLAPGALYKVGAPTTATLTTECWEIGCMQASPPKNQTFYDLVAIGVVYDVKAGWPWSFAVE
jgi:hypothetical protein